MLARWTLVIGLLSVASLILGPLLSGIRLLSPLAGFGLTSAGGALGIFGFLVGVVAAFRSGVGAAAPGLAVCGLITAALIGFVLLATRYPPINDITTDTANPPEFLRALSLTPNHGRDLSYPGAAFAQRQQAAYPDIQPLPLPMAPPSAFSLVEKTAQTMPHWQITVSDKNTLRLEVVAESPLFRFLDDIVIQVRATDGGSVVHMRSRSREGKGDLGANAARIRDFLAALRQAASQP